MAPASIVCMSKQASHQWKRNADKSYTLTCSRQGMKWTIVTVCSKDAKAVWEAANGTAKELSGL